MNEKKGGKGEIKVAVVETDTGDVWMCPVCKEKFHLCHIREETPVKTKKDKIAKKRQRNKMYKFADGLHFHHVFM